MRIVRMMRTVGIMAAASLGLVLAATPAGAAACCAARSGGAGSAASRPAAAGAETYVATLRVTGRTCAACDRSVEAALKRIEGVRSVAFDGETVTVVAARTVAESRLVEAVERAGGERHAFRAEALGCRGHSGVCDLRGRRQR